jgi:RES domain-containing protein
VWNAEGARRFGRRWNARGQGVIYAALAYSTAMLEVLVHANTGRPPPQSRYVTAEAPDDVSCETADVEALPGWDDVDVMVARAFATDWWRERRSAVLLVPSVVTKLDLNAVVNVEHPEAARIVVSAERPVAWDARLFARTGYGDGR